MSWRYLLRGCVGGKKTIESDKLGTLKKATKSGKRKHNDCSL
jgi:hypothetical protein